MVEKGASRDLSRGLGPHGTMAVDRLHTPLFLRVPSRNMSSDPPPPTTQPCAPFCANSDPSASFSDGFLSPGQ